MLFNDGWKFTKQTIGTSFAAIQGKDTVWQDVDLPHDWLIYNTLDLYETSEGWYRKSFELTAEEVPQGSSVVSICFDGVYMDSTVYVNSGQAGEWKYGYSSFEFDITDLISPGENEIIVRAVHQAPNSRWYSGAGIYRNVWLKTSSTFHLVTDGIYLTTRQEQDTWYVELETEAVRKAYDREGSTGGVVRHSILDNAGTEIAVSENRVALCNEVSLDKQVCPVQNPFLWTLDKPYLYTLRTQILVDNTVTDEETQRFGFRTTRFDPEEGFFLNGKHVKLHGVNEHHDLGSLGAAVNKAALRRKLTKLKDMGVNAVRTSHNMPAVELMELADEMGILIDSESFDMWELKKTDYDYSRFFPEWCDKDVASWIRRDRNHPSVILWSIGNEIYDTHAGIRGLEITKMLKNMVLTHDPKGNSHVTIGSNFMSGENAQKCAGEVLVEGYNYAEYLYEEHHEKYPHWCIYGSETASTLQSRGIYHFPADKLIVTYEDEQCSSLDNCTVSWGAKNGQKNITDDRDASYCMGQFIWTGFDYIGEPTPYTTKNSYFGSIDTAGFPKDQFYLYQAEWTDYKVKPMVHILPYWDFNPGQLIDIRIYSNAPKTELFFNDRSLGVYEIDHKKGKQLSGIWQLPYEPGTIKAVAYDEEGNVIATDLKSSFSDPAKIILQPDKNNLQADGRDLIFVEISMEDEHGIPVDNANNRVEVTVNGAGRLIGLDNGDSTDYDQYKGSSRRLFSGKLLAIVAAKLEAGDIRVKVATKGLPEESLLLKALPCGSVTGVSAIMGNATSESVEEVPVRKIELTRSGSNHLDKENPVVKVAAKLYPTNATYDELVWKAVTIGGIETNVAEIEVVGKEATITALGDGEFRLRCSANNGGRIPQIISELEFEITGVGAATINPYQMVDAGLYNAGNHDYETGLLGGISTMDGTENQVGFVGLDFGDYGSDEVTLPVNYWADDSIPVEIWEGIPCTDGSELLLSTQYQAKLVWATFQPNTFRLPKRLKGIKTVCFVFHNKTNWKGFEFRKYEKAYEHLSVKDNSQIYGDTFTLMEDAIENIGNNVTIEFENMNFGEEGSSKLVINGRSNNDKNTINIRFSNDQGSEKQIVEFPFSEDYIEKEFILEPVKGNKKVSFEFLPGSNFDFKNFRFSK
jgi:beta-galactosidase